MLPCVTLGDTPTDEEIDDLKKQLWVAENVGHSPDKVVLRNVCTELFIKKVSDCETRKHADEVYPNQYCKTRHFDLALVPRDLCVDDDKYNVDSCLWNKEEAAEWDL